MRTLRPSADFVCADAAVVKLIGVIPVIWLLGLESANLLSNDPFVAYQGKETHVVLHEHAEDLAANFGAVVFGMKGKRRFSLRRLHGRDF